MTKYQVSDLSHTSVWCVPHIPGDRRGLGLGHLHAAGGVGRRHDYNGDISRSYPPSARQLQSALMTLSQSTGSKYLARTRCAPMLTPRPRRMLARPRLQSAWPKARMLLSTFPLTAGGAMLRCSLPALRPLSHEDRATLAAAARDGTAVHALPCCYPGARYRLWLV